jgi:predicted nucleic acid-binding Zn ribbon protein
MRRSNDQKLSEVIRELLKAYRLDNKLNEVRLIKSWDEVVGKMISKHTKNLYIKRRTLFVTLDSPALKNELSFARTKIIEALNKEVGEEVIEEIVFR